MGLAFPCGEAPGFDPTHIAASGIRQGLGVSFIPVGANFISLLSGVAFTLTGTITNKIFGVIGPATGGTSGTGRASIASTSIATGARSAAAIVQFTAMPAAFKTLINDSIVTFTVNAANNPQLFYNNAQHSSSVTLVAGVPYFIAASAISGGAFNILVMNLLTGAITLTSSTSADTFASIGTTIFAGNNNNGAQPMNGGIAAGMYSPAYLSPQQLLQWAADPWRFWYPGMDI